MSLKNTLIRAALKSLPGRKFSHATPERILVVATTAVGDTLWATPALASLRTSFPDAYIAVLTSPIGLQILKHNPSINALYLFQNLFLLWKHLYQQQFDTALIFHASQRLPLPLCSAIGAARIVGTAGLNKGLDSLLTDPLPNLPQHEITRRLKMVEAIGGTISTETLSLFLQPEERKAMILEPGEWIGIHPGSKDGFKRWPPSHFAEVGRKLAAHGYQILITGTAEEGPLMQKVAQEIPGSRLMPEQLTLRQFAALLEKLSLLISNDTGPVHLACALHKPVVAIYSSTDPKICGPHAAKNAIALSRPPTCTPCLKRKCHTPFCFLQIGACEVVDAALKLLICKGR